MKLKLLSLLLVLSLIIMPSCSSDIEKLKEEYITVKIDSATDLCGKIKNVEITKEII